MRYRNFDFWDSCIKCGLSFIIFLINSFLGTRYVGHSRRKCISSSTLVGQKGQNLSSFGVLGDVCLPFSILRVWFERRNLVKDCLTSVFFILGGKKVKISQYCSDIIFE